MFGQREASPLQAGALLPRRGSAWRLCQYSLRASRRLGSQRGVPLSFAGPVSRGIAQERAGKHANLADNRSGCRYAGFEISPFPPLSAVQSVPAKLMGNQNISRLTPGALRFEATRGVLPAERSLVHLSSSVARFDRLLACRGRRDVLIVAPCRVQSTPGCPEAPCRAHRSAGGPVRCNTRRAACDRNPAGAGPSRKNPRRW